MPGSAWCLRRPVLTAVRRFHRLGPSGVVALLLTAPLAGQAPGFDVGRLRLGLDSMSISLERDGKSVPLGMIWDELTIVEAPGGPPTLRRVTRTINRALGPHLDTALTSLPALRPLYRHTVAGLARDSLTLVGDTLVGWVADTSTGRRPIHRFLPTGVVELGSFDFMIRAAPWTPELVLTAEAFVPAQDTVIMLTARWGGEESVRLADGQLVECWRIEAEVATLKVTSWIDRRTHAVAKGRIQLTPALAMVMLK